MAKLTRKYQKIFAATGPSGVVGQFGSYRAGNPVYTSDQELIQSLGAYEYGWGLAGMTGNVPMLQDMNGLFNQITKQLAYLFQAGIAERDTAKTYYFRSLVSDGAGNVYSSLVDNNLNQALTDATKWFFVHGIKQKIIQDNYTLLNTDYIVTWANTNPTVDHDRITFPTPAAHLVGRKYIIIMGGSTQSRNVSLYSNGAEFDSVTYPRVATYICDGAVWGRDGT